MNITTLPNLIALIVLVAVFWSILRRDATQRLDLWLAGWILVLLHFTAELWDVSQQPGSRTATTVSLDCLALASIAFLISVATVASTRRRQVLLAITLAVPALAYINAVIWNVASPKYYYSVIAAGFIAPMSLCVWLHRRADRHAAIVSVGAIVVTLATAWTVVHGDPDMGISFVLAALNFAVAILYWNYYRRATAGVLTAVAGFAFWGAVFPVAILLQTFVPSAKVEREVWNIPKYLVAVGMILTLLEKQIEKSRYLAYHDELTGLPNRRLLEDRLYQALALANRTRQKVAVLVVDLDHFKEVNDNFGHRVGDLALQEVVARLAISVRACDTLARSGGDEFTVVSHVADAAGAEALLVSLERALSTPIVIQNTEVQTGLSVGLALYPDDAHDPDQLHAAADRAMYAAKRAGRVRTLSAVRRSGPSGNTRLSPSEQGAQ